MTGFEYNSCSVGELVREIESLGIGQELEALTLKVAVHPEHLRSPKRYKTKQPPVRQFYLGGPQQKKYFYDRICNSLKRQEVRGLFDKFHSGFNCSVVSKFSPRSFKSLYSLLDAYEDDSAISGLEFSCQQLDSNNQVTDLASGRPLVYRELETTQCPFYEVKVERDSFEDSYSARIQSSLRPIEEGSIVILRLRNPYMGVNSTPSCSVLSLILLPEVFFDSEECPAAFLVVKNQLSQILNYLKVNPKRRYEHISKLISKRHPLTSYLTKLLMTDSANAVINWIQDTEAIQSQSSQRKTKKAGEIFEFLDKLGIICNLQVRSPETQLSEAIPLESIQQFNQKLTKKGNQRNSQSKAERELHSPYQLLNHKTQTSKSEYLAKSAARYGTSQFDLQQEKSALNDHHKAVSDGQNNFFNSEDEFEKQDERLYQKEMSYCRSLERKTHKYSISHRGQARNEIDQKSERTQGFKVLIQRNEQALKPERNDQRKELTEKKVNGFEESPAKEIHVNETVKQSYRESEALFMLQAQHQREVSQYHQTIQNLNRKIMILTKEKGLEDLYKIHEREMMLLELKIQELRQDIVELTAKLPPKSGEASDAEYDRMAQKMAVELRECQEKIARNGQHEARLMMCEKELKQTQQRLGASEKVREHLVLELETTVKRLRIRDSELAQMNAEEMEKYNTEELSVTEEQLFDEVRELVGALQRGERLSAEHLLRKVSLVLGDLSRLRGTVLECNDFLVELMEVLESRLGSSSPEVVLDSNRFIRGFIMDSLSIF